MEIHEASKQRDYLRVRNIVTTNRASIRVMDEENKTPLFVAVEQNDFELVKMFLTCGARPNVKTKKNDWTALHCAAHLDHTKLIPILFSFGADLEQTAADSMTPLLVAVANGNFESTTELLKLGSNPNASQNTGENSLYYAIKQNNIKFVQTLLDYGADVNALIGSIGSPLHLACSENKEEIIKILIDFGADRHVKNEASQYPRDLSENSNLMQLLDPEKKKLPMRTPSFISPISFQFNPEDNKSEEIKEIMTIESQLINEVNKFFQQNNTKKKPPPAPPRQKNNTIIVNNSQNISNNNNNNINIFKNPNSANRLLNNSGNQSITPFKKTNPSSNCDIQSRKQFASNLFGAAISISAPTIFDEPVEPMDLPGEGEEIPTSQHEEQVQPEVVKERKKSQRIMSISNSIALSLTSIEDGELEDIIEEEEEIITTEEQVDSYFGTDDVGSLSWCQ